MNPKPEHSTHWTTDAGSWPKVKLAPKAPWSRIGKRAMDIAGAAVGLACTAPIIGAAAVAVRLTSPGPVFYRWRIVGEGGRPLVSYKLRTMRVDADRLRASLGAQNQMSGPFFKMDNDPRITPVGRVLRRYSIDELPQLWSVLRGDLSLVGPRPAQWHEWPSLADLYSRRISVRPGLTCLWQVSGRHRITSHERWMELDMQYVDRASLLLDLEILLRTIPEVLRGGGQ